MEGMSIIKPLKGNRITDSTFKYTPSYATDIRKRFAAVQRELAAARKAGGKP